VASTLDGLRKPHTLTYSGQPPAISLIRYNKKRVELAELNAATTKLLSELGELEGAHYTHSILSDQLALGNKGRFSF
jgi:hypothetical protein